MESSLLIPETAGLPAALKNASPLWETLTVARNPGETNAATRLYATGELLSYGTTRRTYKKEQMGREPAPPAWRLDARLTPESVTALRSLLQKEFVPLGNSTVSAPPPPGCQIWRARRGKTAHTLVVMQPSRDWGNLPPVLRTIHETIQKGIVPGGVPVEQAE